MDKFVRICKTVNSRGDLIPLETFKDPVKLNEILKKDQKLDWYSSLFYFGPDGKEYFDKNDSTRGYNGSAYTDKLVFDFDSSDINKARQDALSLLALLQTEGVNVAESCSVFFSGNKGFHVELLTNKEFSPEEAKIICSALANNLDSFDTVIYNRTRLYRIVNTPHPKSNLYKIELDPQELEELTVEQIKAKAEHPVYKAVGPKPVTNVAFLDKFKNVKAHQPVRVNITSDESGIRGIDQIDFNKCPRTTPRCIYALTQGVMQSGAGERSQIFLRLAAFYKNQGMTKDVAYNTLKGISRENARLYPEHEPFDKDEIWNTVISSVYSDTDAWKTIPGAAGTDSNNETIKRYCTAIDKHTNKKCCLHSKVDNHQNIVQIEQVSDSFRNFAENFDRNTVKTGIGFIDEHMNIAIGTTTLLVGATGSGKTTAALNIMENANALNQHTMFFSLDMHKNLIYLKLAQKLTSYSQQQILDFYKNKDQAKIELIRKAIATKYGKTYFDFSSTLTLEQMRDKVLSLEEQHGHKIKLVVVDYAGRVSGPFSDRYANATYNALKSTEVANVTDAAWIFISQISRNVGDGLTPLRTKRAAKESGDWEESSTNVLTIWRPFMGDPSRDDVVRMFLAKNRMGKELEQVLHFDGAKGIIRDHTLDELADYALLREKEEKDYLKARLNRTNT